MAAPRDRILFLLKTKGPQTAAALGRQLGVTSMAARVHLQALQAEQVVSFTDERRKVGRPARVWSLTESARGRFPDTHGELTVELIRAVREAFGESGLERAVGERTRQQRASYLSRMPAPDAPIEERIDSLAAIRSADGYMAEWMRDGEGSWLLSENHCPICAAATVCQGFCRDELAMFRELLGPGVVVTREEHLLAGARRCTYRVQAAGIASQHPGAGSGASPAHRSPARKGERR